MVSTQLKLPHLVVQSADGLCQNKLHLQSSHTVKSSGYIIMHEQTEVIL